MQSNTIRETLGFPSGACMSKMEKVISEVSIINKEMLLMYNVGIFLFNEVELLDFAGPYVVLGSYHGAGQITSSN